MKHKYSRVALTICAYLLGLFVARQLRPISHTVASDVSSPASYVAQADKEEAAAVTLRPEDGKTPKYEADSPAARPAPHAALSEEPRGGLHSHANRSGQLDKDQPRLASSQSDNDASGQQVPERVATQPAQGPLLVDLNPQVPSPSPSVKSPTVESLIESAVSNPSQPVLDKGPSVAPFSSLFADSVGDDRASESLPGTLSPSSSQEGLTGQSPIVQVEGDGGPSEQETANNAFADQSSTDEVPAEEPLDDVAEDGDRQLQDLLDADPTPVQDVADESDQGLERGQPAESSVATNEDEELLEEGEGNASPEDERPAPRLTPRPLSPELLALKRKVRYALNIYRHRNLNTNQHSAWSIMHSFVGYGVEKEIFLGGSNGKRVNAIGWICWNGVCRGERLFYLHEGRIVGRRGPGRQGHEGQFLAMLAQSRVKGDYPMRIGGSELTVMDLVKSEQATCRAKTELTFKLIGVSHYLDADAEWKNLQGETWDVERMVAEELRQPVIGAACGGTHRLFALAYAIERRKKQGLPIDGHFGRAEIFLEDYHDYALGLQNRDGSFSTAYFAGREAKRDLARRIETTGHIAEWLAFSLPEEQLRRPEMIKAINYLAGLLIGSRDEDIRIGPLGHSIHALNIFDQRALEVPAEQVVRSLNK